MKRILILSLVLCLVAGMALSACKPSQQGSADSGTAAPTDDSETTTKTNDKESPMKTITICGKKLSGFRIIADKTETPAGKYLQSTLKEKTGAKTVILLAYDDINKTYSKLPFISVLTLPINGEVYNLADDEAKFFEEDGNFRIVVGSRKVSELTAAQYFVEHILDGSVKDLKGYSETAKLQKDETIAPLIEKAEEQAAQIMQSGNHYSAKDVTGAGKCYYVSFSTGSDTNDGLSPEKPWKTINKVSETTLARGSVVLFKRGDTWRLDDYSRGNTYFCYFRLQSGVTYSSYGDGAKPTISGSPRDLAKTGTWTQTEYKNVWKYSEVYDGMSNINPYYNDVGNLIFNNGEAFGYKMIKGTKCPAVANGLGSEVFSRLGDLNLNYEFWFNPEECQIYLYYDGGNPGECFESIEAAVRLNLMRANNVSDVTVDNFILTYGGAHGVSTALVDNVKITNCEFRWIGGGIYDSSVSNVRYGNGIEFNLNSENCWADGNLFYQIYDAGATHQFDTRNRMNDTTTCYHKNINYVNNVFEYCIYSIEFFESHTKTSINVSRYMADITISENQFLYAGYGFGYWVDGNRTLASHIQSWYGHLDCEIVDGTVKAENNVFLLSKYRMALGTTESEMDVTDFRNNTFVQLEGNGAFLIGEQSKNEDDGMKWDAKALEQYRYLKGKSNKFLTVR